MHTTHDTQFSRKPRLIKKSTQVAQVAQTVVAKPLQPSAIRTAWLTEAKRNTLTPRQQFAQLFAQ